jgi:type IV pilus assembly protein PilM
MAQNILGLDIGSHTIKVVEMGSGKGGLQLLNFATMPTPPGVLQQGVINDPQTLGQSIKQLLTGNGIKTKKVVSSVAGQTSLVVRIIDMPRAAPSELKEMVPFEIDRYIPFADSEPIYSWEVVDRLGADPNSPNMEVLFAAAQPDMIQSHVEALQAAGLQPQAIEVEPLAVGRPFVNVPGGPDGIGETIAIINLGAGVTEISIVKDGLLHFPRTIPVAGEAITRAIAEGLAVSPHQAERLKREQGAVLREPPTGFLEEEPAGPSATIGTYSLGGGTLDEASDSDIGFRLSDTAAEEEPSGLDFSFSLDAAEEESETGAAAPVFDLSLDQVEEEGPVAAAGGPTFSFSMEDTDAGVEEEPPTASPSRPGAGSAPSFAFDLSEEGTEGAGFVEEESGPTFDLSDESTDSGVSFFEEEASGPIFDLSAGAEEESTGTAFDLTGDISEPGTDSSTDFGGPEGRDAAGLAGLEGADAAPGEDVAMSQQVYGCMESVLNELVTEIRRSLEYYRNRHENADIDRIILVGGTARLRNLDQFLQDELGVRVEYGDPLAHLSVANPSLADDYLYNHAPLLAISVGLAMHQLVE